MQGTFLLEMEFLEKYVAVKVVSFKFNQTATFKIYTAYKTISTRTKSIRVFSFFFAFKKSKRNLKQITL